LAEAAVVDYYEVEDVARNKSNTKENLDMRLLRLAGLLTAFSFCLVCFPTTMTRGQGKGEEITLRSVKYDELAREVAKHQGKVVVVDLWGVG
jgi:hypothetical protein